MSDIESPGIRQWVMGIDDPAEKELRQAVHTLCVAIAETSSLQKEMIMKGGILLAIKFKSTRYTKDVDFSTSGMYKDFCKENFLYELAEGLALAVDQLNYGLDCKIQSHRIKPPGDDKNYQTLEIKIAHAYKSSKKYKKLMAECCPSVLKIDYSFNEHNRNIDIVKVEETKNIRAYSLADLVAEKYRAIIQQKDRDRVRRQDAYDIHYLIENGYLDDEAIKPTVLESLKIKSESRGLNVEKMSLDDEEIRRRSEEEYNILKGEIDGDLPDFDICYGRVNEYYKSLPWEEQL